MREIKFRAWDKTECKMHYDITYVLFSKAGSPPVVFTAEDVVIRQSGKMHGYSVELMQYTGLKDKNGKEIYEGDIVKTTVGKHLWWYLVTTDSNFGGNNLYLITRYRNFRHTNVEDEIEWGDFFVNECRDTLTEYNANKNLEVIGNIYENPELLES